MLIVAGDPFVLYDKKSKKYYCYSTKGKYDANFAIYESNNLYDWDFVDFAIRKDDPNNVGESWFWAPECYYNENNGYYYLFYSCRLKKEYLTKHFGTENFVEGCKICLAVSKSPKGPFKILENNPIDFYPFDEKYIDINSVTDNPFDPKVTKETLNSVKKENIGVYFPFIDVNLLFDEDRIFLYCSRNCYKNCLYDDEKRKFIEESCVIGVELETEWWKSKTPVMPKIKKEFINFVDGRRKDKYVNLISYRNQPQAWENANADDYFKTKGQLPNRRWSEGSTTFVVNIGGKKKYALTYSCNFYGSKYYAVGIAFSDNPLGPFVKSKANPIIGESGDGFVSSVGHGCVVYKGKDTYYAHHARQMGSDRVLAITKFKINSEDNIEVGKTEFANSLVVNKDDEGFVA